MSKSTSIREVMGAPDGKLIIGGVPKSDNKDDLDLGQPEKIRPKPKLQPL